MHLKYSNWQMPTLGEGGGEGKGEGGGYHRCVGSVGSVGVDFCYLSLSVLFLSERMNDARAGYWLIAKAFEILFETFNLRWVR